MLACEIPDLGGWLMQMGLNWNCPQTLVTINLRPKQEDIEEQSETVALGLQLSSACLGHCKCLSPKGQFALNAIRFTRD